MAILSKLTKEVVAVPLQATSKDEALREMVKLLKKAQLITNEDEAYKAIIAREHQGSTGLGEEIAIPHAKTTTVASIAIAVGISPKGIDFQSIDAKPVKIFFLILANPEQASAHIEALSEIAKLTRNKSFCKLLLAAENSSDIIHLFTNDE